MTLRIDMTNESCQNIVTFMVHVKENWLYQATRGGTTHTRTFSRTLVSFREAVDVPPNMRKTYEREIELPNLQPSYACAIIVHDFHVAVSRMVQSKVYTKRLDMHIYGRHLRQHA